MQNRLRQIEEHRKMDEIRKLRNTVMKMQAEIEAKRNRIESRRPGTESKAKYNSEKNRNRHQWVGHHLPQRKMAL